MSAIGPGDWVECIYSNNPASVTVGRVFLCLEVWNAPQGCERNHGPCAGINVAGMRQCGGGYALCCFRPIYRPKAEFIESLMQPAPELEPVA